MIVKFWKPGRSFNGLVQYLTHDAAADRGLSSQADVGKDAGMVSSHPQTSERVAWTHTLNLANEDVASAVDEMVWTFRNAEFFKQAAGVHGGGKKVQKPVKHVTLAWHPSEAPSKDEMIKAAEDFLRAMSWPNQTIVVAHTDRKHPHIHLAINVIGEDGRALNARFEYRRAQTWARRYEQGRGKIFCYERLKSASEREPSPPRPVWQLLEEARGAHEQAEAARLDGSLHAREARLDAESLEWRILQELQKEQRLAFFEQGRAAFKTVRNQVYREIRKAFAQQWSVAFRAERAGADPDVLAAFRADIKERQTIVLKVRRDATCETLRLTRNVEYRKLLDEQKRERGELLRHQERNLSAMDMLRERAERGDEAFSAIADAKNRDGPGTSPGQGPGASSGQGLFPSSGQGSGASPHDRLHRDPIEERLRWHAERASDPFQWTGRAGMVAQNRSANAYLERIERRSRRETVDTQPRKQFVDRSADRLVAAGAGRSADTGRGIEPGSD